MREYIFWAFLLLSIPYIFKRPFWGVVLYSAFNIIRPEMLFWGGSAGAKSFIILIGATLFGTIFNSPNFSIKLFMRRELLLMLWLYIALIVSIALSQYEAPKAYYYANEMFKLFVLCLLITKNVNDVEEVKKYEDIMLLAFVLLGIWGIQQYFLGNYRLEGLGGHAFTDSNGVAAMFVLFLPLALNKLITPARKIDCYAGLIASFVIIALIVCTSSRGGFVGMVACSAFFTLRSQYKIKIAVMTVFIMLLLAPFLTENYLSRISSITSNEETRDYSSRSRLVLWKAGMMIFCDNPIFGTGFMTYPSAKMQYKGEFDYLEPEFQEYVFKTDGSRVTHNTYVQMFSEGGLFLALPFFVFILGTFWKNWRVRKKHYIDEDNREMLNLLSAIEAGIIGYGISIFFINALMGVFLYVQITLCAIIRKIIINNSRKVSAPPRNLNGLQAQ